MKISKKTLLAISGMLSTSALGLMFVSAADRTLYMNLNNAVQHINEVKIISTRDDAISSTLGNSDGLVKIDTESFIIGDTGDNENFIGHREAYVSYSSILGGIKNTIAGTKDVILGGSRNIVGGTFNTIVGGEGNNLNYKTCGSYNTIIGGKNNRILGDWNVGCLDGASRNHSVIVGGENNSIYGHYSVVMGNNSSVTGNNSVALGSGSNIKANNSFLWTDGNNSETLQTNDVFVVMAQSGAIINSDKAHSFAKLTLGGALVLSVKDEESDIQCGMGEGGGIIKIKKSENNQLCLCSCDGSGWNSMFTHGACSKVCNESIEPPQCRDEVNTICTRQGIMYSGSCINGKVVEGTGAYFVDKNDVVHRSCQTPDGQVNSSCSGKVSWTAEEKIACMNSISRCVGGAKYDEFGNSCSSSLDCDDNQTLQFNEGTQERECVTLGKCTNKRGTYEPNNNKDLIGFSDSHNYQRYLPVGTNKERTCKDDGITEDDIHSCTFSCGESYKCDYINSGGRVTSHNVYASCIPINGKCQGDYRIHDDSKGKYNQRTRDGSRFGTVYKNPNPNSTENTTFQFVNSENEVNTNQYGCYILCDPGYHEPWTSDDYHGEDTFHDNGRCLPNCQDLRRDTRSPTLTPARFYTSTATNARMKENNRRPWKYKEFDVYSDIINSAGAGLTSGTSCLWSCTDGATPLIIAGQKTEKRAYYMSGEKRGSTVIQEFSEFLDDERNYNLYDNGNYAVCRKQCNQNQYFNGFMCAGIGNYVKDETNCITFNGITNCGRTNACPTGQLWNYTTKKCEPASVTLKQLCDEKIATKPRYRRIPSTNECKMCETIGQYVTENGECARCDNPTSPECTKQST